MEQICQVGLEASRRGFHNVGEDVEDGRQVMKIGILDQRQERLDAVRPQARAFGIEPFADQHQEAFGRFLSQADEAGGEQRGAHGRVAHLRRPGGETREQAFLARRQASKQGSGQQAHLQPALVPQMVGEIERRVWIRRGERDEFALDLFQDDGGRAVRFQHGVGRDRVHFAQAAVDVEVQHPMQGAREFLGPMEEVGQLRSLFFQAGEVYGGHGDVERGTWRV